jgi:hypothetical protein
VGTAMPSSVITTRPDGGAMPYRRLGDAVIGPVRAHRRHADRAHTNPRELQPSAAPIGMSEGAGPCQAEAGCCCRGSPGRQIG